MNKHFISEMRGSEYLLGFSQILMTAILGWTKINFFSRTSNAASEDFPFIQLTKNPERREHNSVL